MIFLFPQREGCTRYVRGAPRRSKRMADTLSWRLFRRKGKRTDAPFAEPLQAPVSGFSVQVSGRCNIVWFILTRLEGPSLAGFGLIDKKSLFGTPRSASTHTGRKHAKTGLQQRSHWEKHGRSRRERQSHR
jgi:hypothetical protein